jgi:hypothetical protein
MPLTFDVDGKTMQDPGNDEIAKGFASIDAEGRRSISMIMLRRAPIELWAFGHPKEGYTLAIDEDVAPKGTRTSKVTSPTKMVPHDEIIRLFQDFARGDDSWQNRFAWEPGITETPMGRVLKRLIAIVLSFLLLVLILKYVLKLF